MNHHTVLVIVLVVKAATAIGVAVCTWLTYRDIKKKGG